MGNQTTTINPFELLNEVFTIDEIAAVRIASKWGTYNSESIDQYNAAWEIVQRQTVFPICISCRWPVIEDDPHTHCEAELCVSIDDEEDGRFGQCKSCKGNLTKSESAFGDVCCSCSGLSHQFMADFESDLDRRYPEESDNDDPDEDPLAGDVELTGGYYEPPIHPFEAQRLEVMRQHGDYTG